MQHLLIRHHAVSLPDATNTPAPRDVLATVLGNLAHYGYGLTRRGLEQLAHADAIDLRLWWPEVEAALRAITGDDKDMASHVVYTNFPAEVLAMSEADYWIRQILMYWGLPNAFFTTPAQPREGLPEADRTVRILRSADVDTPGRILADLLGSPARWQEQQWQDVQTLAAVTAGPVAVDAIPFKENLVRVVQWLMEQDRPATVSTGTDVLRLAVGLSDGDVDLREPAKLRSFARWERRYLLGMLESARHLDEDLARRPERFKRLLHALRPGDYRARFPRVVSAYDALFNDRLPPTWASGVERSLTEGDASVLATLAERPGEFVRRLHATVLRFGAPAVEAFVGVLPRLSVTQLLSIRRYLATVNGRRFRTIAPKGNWNRLQVLPNPSRRYLEAAVLARLDAALADELQRRLAAVVPSVDLDERLRDVTLPTNDGDLLPYGRGTAFALPEHVTFVRTASYWASGPTASNVWYDNGWNFFDAAWGRKGVCCWNTTAYANKGAVFSGDPTNSKDLKGRACQLIDLYLDKLLAHGVRYGVWSLLCYSRKSFDEAEEMFGLLQWGSEAQTGRLIEPSRAQLAFPVTGAGFTKFVAYLDLRERKLVFMDANLRARVDSAQGNQEHLAKRMPAFVEYLDSLPTVHDLLTELPAGDDLVARYDDAGEDLSGRTAYVFRPRSEDGDVVPFALSDLLGA